MINQKEHYSSFFSLLRLSDLKDSGLGTLRKFDFLMDIMSDETISNMGYRYFSLTISIKKLNLIII